MNDLELMNGKNANKFVKGFEFILLFDSLWLLQSCHEMVVKSKSIQATSPRRCMKFCCETFIPPNNKESALNHFTKHNSSHPTSFAPILPTRQTQVRCLVWLGVTTNMCDNLFDWFQIWPAKRIQEWSTTNENSCQLMFVIHHFIHSLFENHWKTQSSPPMCVWVLMMPKSKHMLRV